MAKYSTFEYGDGTKYGAGDQDADLRWGFIVAWDGYYGWGNEADSRMVDLNVRRGRKSMIAQGGKGFEPFQPGEMTIVLDNSDGRYDPFNTSSPLYPNVTPGKFCRLSVHSITEDQTYDVFYGKVADIQPIRQGRTERVRITAVDGLQLLKDSTINVGLQQNISKDTPPIRIMQYIDWPNVEWPRVIYEDATTHDYWWAWNQNAFEAMKEWNNAEVAVTFHARDGHLLWRPRSFTKYRERNIDASEILREIGRPQPWETVRNNIRSTVRTKVLDEIDTTIWSLGSTPALAAGETFYIEPSFRYGEFSNICGAAVVFAFTVNTAADGSGSDISDDCELVFIADIGEGARCWLSNRGSTSGYITSFTASGDAIYPPYEEVLETDDYDSKTAYGFRTLTLDSRWLEDIDYVRDMVAWLISNLKDPIQQPIIQLENNFRDQFYLDLWDVVNLTIAELDIDTSYRIGHITHQMLTESGQGVRTTYELEPYLVDA